MFYKNVHLAIYLPISKNVLTTGISKNVKNVFTDTHTNKKTKTSEIRLKYNFIWNIIYPNTSIVMIIV